MAKKSKNSGVMTYLKETKVSLLVGTLALFTQTIIILNLIPSIEVEHQSVLKTNVQALIDMTIN